MTSAFPNSVDVHVGVKVRECRKALGISQEALATALNLSFQQIQKYERGANRISASKLYEIGRFLGVSADYFFEGLDQTVDDVSDSQSDMRAQSFMKTAEGIELAKWFNQISTRQRRGVLALVRSLDDQSS
jgi:transcriptional regulator with XRE-family HTH domain